MKTLTISKYRFLFWQGIKSMLEKKGEIIGRMIAYVIMLCLYRQITTSANINPSQILYIAANQWIIFCGGHIAFDIASDIETEKIKYCLLEPYNYLIAKFCESSASTIIKFLCIGVLCCVLNNHFNFLALIFILFAAIFQNIVGILIGLMAFYVKDIKQIFYLNMTASFTLGGLLVPLRSCPSYIQIISSLTPYPYILNIPAESFSVGNIQFLEYFKGLIIWTMIILVFIKILYRRVFHD
jgi:ABC-type uncharacterized transport system permease subunit